MIKCTQENWNYAIVASKATVKDLREFYRSVDDPIVDEDRCEEGGFHLWTNSTVEWFLEQEKNAKAK